METDGVQVTRERADDESGIWMYRVTVPDSGHTWEVSISRHRSRFNQRVIESYSWQCRWDHMQGGSFINQQHADSQERALEVAVRYIRQQEGHEATSP